MKKEDILGGFMSGDAHKVLSSSHEVIHSVITNRDMIRTLAPYLNQINKATRGLDYGGAILPNKRFVEKAIKIISESRSNKCLCEYTFDGFGQSAKSLQKYGFIVLSEKMEGYINIGKIECPRDHQQYIVEEEYTGWHITSSRYRKE